MSDIQLIRTGAKMSLVLSHFDDRIKEETKLKLTRRKDDIAVDGYVSRLFFRTSVSKDDFIRAASSFLGSLKKTDCDRHPTFDLVPEDKVKWEEIGEGVDENVKIGNLEFDADMDYMYVSKVSKKEKVTYKVELVEGARTLKEFVDGLK